MADGKRQVEQIVKLNVRQYLEPLAKIKSETRSTFGDVSKSLFQSGGRFSEYSNQIKKGAANLSNSLGDLGKSFAQNLGRGALAGGATAGFFALKNQMDQSVKTGMEFGKSFAQLASRADLSKEKIKSLRNEIKALGKSGVDLASLPAAVQELYGVTGNVDQAMAVMDPISKAAALGKGDASEVARFVKDRLTGEGRDINKSNVDSVLQGLVSAQRGGDFKDMSEAMSMMSGVDGMAKKASGLSDKELSAIMAGATRAGGPDTKSAMAGVNALVKASANPIQSSALAGILGIGDLKTGGKLDISKLGQSGVHERLMGMGGGNETQAREIFKQTSGLSETESDAVFTFVKNFEAMNKGIKKTMADTKTLDQAFDESTNNLTDRLQRLRNGIVTGFDDIFSPLEEVATDLVSGNFAGGLKKLPGALKESLGGVMDNKALALGGLGALAGGGALLGKLGGLMGGGGGAGLAKGVGMGKALEQMGVQPVYVVNAQEIGNNMSMTQKGIADILGGGGAAGGAPAAAGGLLARLGPALRMGGIAAAAGGVGYGVGTGVDMLQDKYTQGTTSEGFEGNAVERLIFKLDKLFGGDKSASIMKVEIDSKDPQYLARPKATDVARSGR